MAVKTGTKKSNQKKPRRSGAAGKKRPPVTADPFGAWMEYLIYALVVLVPLTFSHVTLDQFDIIKMEIFRVLTFLVLVLWLLKLFTSRAVKITWTKLDWLLLGFLALAFISTLNSIHVFSSLQGKYKRYEGLYTFFNYALIYFLALQVFQDRDKIARLARIISYAAMAVAAYGLIQYVGLDPINWGATPFNARSSFSTFGNPDLLGAYLALTLPITLANFLSSKNQRKTAIFGVGYFLVAASLLTTYTRGAWLGGLFGVFVLPAVVGFKRLKANWLKLLVVHLIFLLFFVGVWIFSSTTAQPGVMNLSSRIKSATKLSSGTVGSRIEIWKAGLAMIKDRPLLGQGLDTYRLASEHFETLKYVKMVKGRIVADNAHNYLVQITAGAGIPAAVSFFTFILGVFYLSLVAIRRRRSTGGPIQNQDLSIAGLTAGAVGYFIYLLSGISVVGSSAIMWIVLGVIAGSGNLRREWRRKQQQAFPALTGLAAVSLVFMSLAVFTFSRMLIADYNIVQFYKLAELGSVNEAMAHAEEAFKLYPNGRYQSTIGRYYLNTGSNNIALVKRGLAAFNKAISAEPLEADNRVFLANGYAVRSSLRNGNQDDIKRAIKELKQTLSWRPYSVPANYLLGSFYLQQKKYALSLKYLKQTERLDPLYPNLAQRLALAYQGLGKSDKAAYYRKKAAEYGRP